MTDWLDGLAAAAVRQEPVALVTVAATRGSTPREAGARMAVGLHGVWDTIGGGQLEHAAIESARLMLESGGDDEPNSVERHVLGPRQGQCCGGVVDLLIERIPGDPPPWVASLAAARRAGRRALVATPLGGTAAAKRVVAQPGELPGTAFSAARALMERCLATGQPLYDRAAGWHVEALWPPDFQVTLFGAGHVGTALAGVLATLPCALRWVDSRPGQLPQAPAANVCTKSVREPETVVADCPPGGFYLVMTHSHPLDFAICERILERGDFAYCGLIGSAAKRASLEKRLKLKGVTQAALNRLTCPIGIDGITGKRPEEIAVAVAAELLAVRDALRLSHSIDPPGVTYGTGSESP